MKLTPIETGFFKLDGGAMFGVVPKRLWSKLIPPDENNLCQWSMRCLLVEHLDRKILIDTGLGSKQDEKFRSHFEPHGDDTLSNSLKKAGLSKEDITDVFLTHFHFDHIGGAVDRDADGQLSPTFPNAKYWTNKKHFDWALIPNPRESASFLKENFVPLAEHQVLEYLPVEQGLEWMQGIHIRFCYGHTEAMMVPEFRLPNGNKIIYTADLMPSSYHARMPYVMGYDIRPLETLNDKASFYDAAIAEDTYCFFEHDPLYPIGKLKKTDRGRYYFDTDLDVNKVLGS